MSKKSRAREREMKAAAAEAEKQERTAALGLSKYARKKAAQAEEARRIALEEEALEQARDEARRQRALERAQRTAQQAEGTPSEGGAANIDGLTVVPVAAGATVSGMATTEGANTTTTSTPKSSRRKSRNRRIIGSKGADKHTERERRTGGPGMFGFGELDLVDNDDIEVRDILADYTKKAVPEHIRKTRERRRKHAEDVRNARIEAKARFKLLQDSGQIQVVRNRRTKQTRYIYLPGVVNTLGIETRDRQADMNDPAEKQSMNLAHNRRDQLLFAPIKRVNKPIVGLDKTGRFFDIWEQRNDPMKIFAPLLERAKEVRKTENGMAYAGLPAFLKFLEGKSKREIIDDYAFEFHRFIKRREVTDFIATMRAPALEWFNRRHDLEESYALMYIDTYPIRLKLGKKKVYVGQQLFFFGITLDGRRDLLGLIPDYSHRRASFSFWTTIFEQFVSMGLVNLCFVVASFKCRYLERVIKKIFPEATMHFNLLEVLQFDSYGLESRLRKSFMEEAQSMIAMEDYNDAYNALCALRDKWEPLKSGDDGILQGNLELLQHVCALSVDERKLLSTNKIVAECAASLMGKKDQLDFFSDHAEMLNYLFYRYILVVKNHWIKHQDEAIYNLTFSRLFSKLRRTEFSGGKLLDRLLSARHQEFMLQHFGHFGNGPVFNLNPSTSRKRIALSGQLHANINAERWVDGSTHADAALNNHQSNASRMDQDAQALLTGTDSIFELAEAERVQMEFNAKDAKRRSKRVTDSAALFMKENAKSITLFGGGLGQLQLTSVANVHTVDSLDHSDSAASNKAEAKERKGPVRSKLSLALDPVSNTWYGSLGSHEYALHEFPASLSSATNHGFEQDIDQGDESSLEPIKDYFSLSDAAFEISRPMTARQRKRHEAKMRARAAAEAAAKAFAEAEAQNAIHQEPVGNAFGFGSESFNNLGEKALVLQNDNALSSTVLENQGNTLGSAFAGGLGQGQIFGVFDQSPVFGQKVALSQSIALGQWQSTQNDLQAQLEASASMANAKAMEPTSAMAKARAKVNAQAAKAHETKRYSPAGVSTVGTMQSSFKGHVVRHSSNEADDITMRKRYSSLQFKVDDGFGMHNTYDLEQVDGLEGLDNYNSQRYTDDYISLNMSNVSSNISVSNAVFGMLRPTINQALKAEHELIRLRERAVIFECLGHDFNFDRVDHVIHQITPIFRSAMQNKIEWHANHKKELQAQEKARAKKRAHLRYLERKQAREAGADLIAPSALEFTPVSDFQHLNLESSTIANEQPKGTGGFEVYANSNPQYGSFDQFSGGMNSFAATNVYKEAPVFNTSSKRVVETIKITKESERDLNAATLGVNQQFMLQPSFDFAQQTQLTSMQPHISQELTFERPTDFSGPVPIPSIRSKIVKNLGVTGVSSSKLDEDIVLPNLKRRNRNRGNHS